MNISCSEVHLSSVASVVLSLWFLFSGLAAVIGNAVMLWLFYRNASLRTISYRFLASLSVADFLVGLVIDPIWIAIRCLSQPFDTHGIKFYIIEMLWIHTTAATTFNVCCVSIDRFIAIRFPFRYQDIVTKNRCHAVITAVWLFSLLAALSRIFVNHGEYVVDENLSWVLIFTAFVLPLFVVTFCYVLIFKTAREQFRRISPQENPHDENVKSRTRENFKAIKTVGVVLSVCIFSWLPSLVSLVVQHYHVSANLKCANEKVYFAVWPWVEAIAFTSSAINPWIYFFRSGDFRQALRRHFPRLSSFLMKISPKPQPLQNDFPAEETKR